MSARPIQEVLCVLSPEQRRQYEERLDQLRVPGIKLQFQSSGERALASIEDANPDLVLVGMEIGAMDGLEFVARLMSRYRDFAGKIIVLPEDDDPFSPTLQYRDPTTGRSRTEQIDFEAIGKLLNLRPPEPAPLEQEVVGSRSIAVDGQKELVALGSGSVELFSAEQFRDRFAQESRGQAVQLDVGERTLLFTDMVGSTQFYMRRGDAAAFAEMREHFLELFSIIGDNQGVVIKTIGDAVMASFGDPVDAVRASKQIHSRFSADRSTIRLRISLNTGPCIVVNVGGAVDYFGGTVNIAAKLQDCIGAGQVAMALPVRDAPGVADYLQSEQAVLVQAVYEHTGLDPIPYARWDT